MTYSAEFVPGQATLADRSVPVAPPTSPFATFRAARAITALAVYAPSLSFDAKPRKTKVGNRTLEFVGLPFEYGHVYLTSVGAIEFVNSGISDDILTMQYRGDMRLAYQPLAPVAFSVPELGAPALHLVEFKPLVWIRIGRGREVFEEVHFMPPAGTPLFPGSVIDDGGGVFIFRTALPRGGNDTVNVGLTRGRVYYGS